MVTEPAPGRFDWRRDRRLSCKTMLPRITGALISVIRRYGCYTACYVSFLLRWYPVTTTSLSCELDGRDKYPGYRFANGNRFGLMR